MPAPGFFLPATGPPVRSRTLIGTGRTATSRQHQGLPYLPSYRVVGGVAMPPGNAEPPLGPSQGLIIQDWDLREGATNGPGICRLSKLWLRPYLSPHRYRYLKFSSHKGTEPQSKDRKIKLLSRCLGSTTLRQWRLSLRPELIAEPVSGNKRFREKQ